MARSEQYFREFKFNQHNTDELSSKRVRRNGIRKISVIILDGVELTIAASPPSPYQTRSRGSHASKCETSTKEGLYQIKKC